jgi:hypothetical protein
MASWTEVADLNTARYGNGATGTTSAGLTFAGKDTVNVSVTESWNGSAWSEVNDMNTARHLLKRCWYFNSIFRICRLYSIGHRFCTLMNNGMELLGLK